MFAQGTGSVRSKATSFARSVDQGMATSVPTEIKAVKKTWCGDEGRQSGEKGCFLGCCARRMTGGRARMSGPRGCLTWTAGQAGIQVVTLARPSRTRHRLLGDRRS